MCVFCGVGVTGVVTVSPCNMRSFAIAGFFYVGFWRRFFLIILLVIRIMGNGELVSKGDGLRPAARISAETSVFSAWASETMVLVGGVNVRLLSSIFVM